jgi:hypothetical protein
MESVLFDCLQDRDHRVLLVDNIDHLTIEAHPTCISALINTIDSSSSSSCRADRSHHLSDSLLSSIIVVSADSNYLPRRRRRMRTVIIASCSSSYNVHASLKQPYRLGSPMLLTEPSLLDKRDVLLSLMLDPNVAVVNDFTQGDAIAPKLSDMSSYKDFIALVANELVLYMKSYSIADIHRYFIEQYQNSSHDSSIGDGVVVRQLSSRQLLKSAINSNPTSSLSSSSSRVINRFMRQFDIASSEPHLIGVDHWKSHLLTMLSTAIPSISDDDYYHRWISSPSMNRSTSGGSRRRRCSGK